MATILEAAESLRARLNLPKDMVSIWIERKQPVIKNRKIIEKAKQTICVTINPKYKAKILLPKKIDSYAVERRNIPWKPVEGQDLAIAEQMMMAKGE